MMLSIHRQFCSVERKPHWIQLQLHSRLGVEAIKEIGIIRYRNILTRGEMELPPIP